MSNKLVRLAVAISAAAIAMIANLNHADRDRSFPEDGDGSADVERQAQLGPRPSYLVNGMDEGDLKSRLLQCANGPFYRTDFSIGHRGAALQFPEHTLESFVAAAQMGAGIIECDVTFTKDGALVCRHAECDLHATTNIVATDLNEKCTRPWNGPGSGAKCCTSDLTLAQFRTLDGKMDASNPSATRATDYLSGTANWRTDLYNGRGTLLTHAESIELIGSVGGKFIPELKPANPERINGVFGSQAKYAQKLIDEYIAASVSPEQVWPQSFNVEDVLYWIDNTDYGAQAIYLLSYSTVFDNIVIQPPYNVMDRNAYFQMLRKRGVRIIAPPIPALLSVNSNGDIIPSKLATYLKKTGFEIITWTFERSDLRNGASQAGYYYDFDSTGRAINKDSDMYKALHALASEVGIVGIFSDWPATVTYYANCMGLE